MENINKVINAGVWNTQHTIPTDRVISFIETALNVATVDGFINPVVVGTMLWLYIISEVMPDRAKEIDDISQNGGGIFVAMDKVQSDGILDRVMNEYAADINYAFALADTWYRQYAKFNPTFAGQVGQLSFLTEDFVKEALEGIQKVLSTNDSEKILQIAEAWGMRNEGELPLTTQPEPAPKEVEEAPKKTTRKKRNSNIKKLEVEPTTTV